MVVPCIWFEIRVNYQLNANICLFGSTCFGLYAHLQEQIEFLLQMRHMVPLLQLGVLRSVRVGGEMHSYCCASHHQRARSSRHRATTRAPYAEFVKEILFAPEDGRITRNMSSQINKYLH